MDDITFLTIEDVLAIHADQLARYGGADGIIDPNVVESAAVSAQHSMFGEYLNKDIAEMAACYFFGFAASQGFQDGNKRTGVAAAGEFLARNGYRLTCGWQEMYDTAMRVGKHLADKAYVADWIRERLQAIP